MEDDGWTGRGVVLEAHGGNQVYEESIALLPELGMLIGLKPKQKKNDRAVQQWYKALLRVHRQRKSMTNIWGTWRPYGFSKHDHTLIPPKALWRSLQGQAACIRDSTSDQGPAIFWCRPRSRCGHRAGWGDLEGPSYTQGTVGGQTWESKQEVYQIQGPRTIQD